MGFFLIGEVHPVFGVLIEIRSDSHSPQRYTGRIGADVDLFRRGKIDIREAQQRGGFELLQNIVEQQHAPA